MRSRKDHLASCPALSNELRALRYGLASSIFLWLVIVVLMNLASSCAAPMRPPLPGPLRLATNDASLPSFSVGGALAAAGLAREQRGRWHLLHGKTACRTASGVNAYILFDQHDRPRVGSPVRVRFVSRAMRPFPSEPMWVIWSLRPAAQEIPLSMTPFGMSGCQLLVNPDNVTQVVEGDQGLFTRGIDGDVLFEWTPPIFSVGATIFAQLLVFAPGETTSGYMLSPAIAIEVGV